MTNRNKDIDPALKIYHGVPLVITNNVQLKKGLGNGTRYIALYVQSLKDCIVNCKTWDGRLINTVS